MLTFFNSVQNSLITINCSVSICPVLQLGVTSFHPIYLDRMIIAK